MLRINDRYNQSLSRRENEMPKSKGQRSADDKALSLTQSNAAVLGIEMRLELHDCSKAKFHSYFHIYDS